MRCVCPSRLSPCPLNDPCSIGQLPLCPLPSPCPANAIFAFLPNQGALIGHRIHDWHAAFLYRTALHPPSPSSCTTRSVLIPC